MKFLITTKRRTNPLPVETMEPARNWINAKLRDGTLDCCYGLVTGGGVSIANAKSHEDLMKMLMEYPESRYVDFEVQDLCDVNVLFREAEALATSVRAGEEYWG